ncbi:MAG TPA: dihydroorotate dehydrogenase [Candidatus Onthomorpha intestinigallinarum]|uniref:Dihydroorotate dehydrogenase n=1 Tax=Candidatus Onthomorpha intestinigallinarum TaxID=2840880 RepID=A0A9D1UGL9_9BACT|nr:dihydroorotate dehydrogenase [Candidatus Onthomorpha intestinigallinarum]
MDRLKISIGNLNLKNPVMTASGTFGFGEEYTDFFDIQALGAIIVKGTTGNKREGNPSPRMCETPMGMINAVGLQNKGVDYFCNSIYNRIKDYDTNMIVNVSGSDIEEYVTVAEKINELEKIHAIELNISCPNVKKGGMGFGTDPNMAFEVVSNVRRVYSKHLIVKLTPNVTSIVDIAKAVEDAGADSLSMINTVLAMAIDAEKRKALLSTITAGLSGPAIKPIGLRCVYQTYKAVKIPIIGLGGITNATDAIEYILAGASAIQIGTQNFINPRIGLEVINGMNEYLERHKINHIWDIRGVI